MKQDENPASARKLRQDPAGTGAGVWIPVNAAPFDRELELGHFEDHAVRALEFPCRRGTEGWENACTGELVDVAPTHWRLWRPG